MKRAIPILLILLLLPIVSAMHFSEVMFDPPGSDNNKEFIEVYGEINLSEWQIADTSSNDTLLPLQRNTSSNYSLIVEEGFDFSGLACNIYSAGATIGNNLNNGGDNIALFDKNGTKRTQLNFSDTFGKNNGYSLEFINKSWEQSNTIGGTPCFPPKNEINNNETNQTEINQTMNETNQTEINQTMNETNQTGEILYDLSIKITLDDILYQHVPYLNLFRIENEKYESGISAPVNTTILYNVTKNNSIILIDSFEVSVNSYKTAGTGRIQLNETGNYTLCGKIVNENDSNTENNHACQNITVLDPFTQQCNISLTLEVENQQLYYHEGERIKFRNRLEQHNSTIFPYGITYTVENLEGKVIKNTTTSNENLKSYTPSTKEKVGLFILKNNLSFLACNNSNNNTYNEQLLVILGSGESYRENESHVDIQEVKPLDATKMNQIPIKVYKGDTGKYIVKLWAEDAAGKRISEISSFQARKKLTEYELSLPLLFKNKEPGLCKLVLEGLGYRDTKSVRVEGEAPKKEVTPISITSFYTRSKKPGEKINLYATIKGRGKYTVSVVGLAGRREENISVNGSYRYKTTAKVLPGPNLYVLEIVGEEAHALLNVTRKEERPNEEEKGEEERIEMSEEKNGSVEISPNLLTGNAIYHEASPTKSLPFLLGIIGALLLAIILQQKQ